jgi:hypothetical protein
MAAGGVFVASAAQAELLAYSGLEGASVGGIDGVSDGSGWATNWDSQNNTNQYQVANAAPLTYGSLQTSSEGNYINGGNSFTNLGRQINNNNGGSFADAGYLSDKFTDKDVDQGVLWFSVLMQPVNNLSNNKIGFTDQNNTAWQAPGETGELLLKTDGASWGLETVGGSFVDSNKNATKTAADLLVLRMNFDGTSSSVHLWVNPTNLATADPATSSADAALTGLDSANIEFRNMHVRLGNNLGDGFADEFRFGETYADVTPVPEPASLALLALGGVMMLGRGKRSV